MRALFSVFLVMLLASCAMSQQANSLQARIYCSQIVNGSPSFFGNTTNPGPHYVTLFPTNAYFYGAFSGTYTMPAALFGHEGAPFPGSMTLSGGIVDIDPSAMILIWEGTLSNPQLPYSAGLGSAQIAYAVPLTPTSPPVGWSATYQGYAVNPAALEGYTLTAAISLARQ